MRIRIATVATALMMSTLFLVGCVERDGCWEVPRDELMVGIGVGLEWNEIYFKVDCETQINPYRIDRYSFALALPDGTDAEILPTDNELDPAFRGSTRYLVTERSIARYDDGERGGDAPVWVLNFTQWEPVADHRKVPTLAVSWYARGADLEADALPGGWYNFTVALRGDPSESHEVTYCAGCGGLR